MQNITISSIPSGFAIKFPFALKTEFRTAFPSAKWNADAKQWEVGPRTGKRLQQWADEAKSAAQAAAANDELDMTEAELARVRADLVKAKNEIERSRSNIAELAALKAALAAEQKALTQVKQEQAEAKQQESAAAADVKTMLSGIINFAELAALKAEMARNHNPANRAAKEKFEAAREKVSKIRATLAAAGWRSEGISAIASANVNRPDRDSVADISEQSILKITKIEE